MKAFRGRNIISAAIFN